ncbi:fatty acid desaturase [Taibaiella soli]|uniref:Fatty acid desaturase n=1 Tax=Taibaiella soli TaxID=1649169 RepID=A0A2W2BF85_9BACT|nr:fatty acid desaturase [Taibaiella soli]PZF74567.1 fatty acid desaturase [Taibaiella soli]
MPKQFRWSDEIEPHKARTKEIIKQHPEIRTLIGRNPYTALVIVLCVALQLSLAYFLRDVSWWWIFIAAYLIGAFACHTLFVCIHECSHNLIFKNRTLNTISGIVANLPLVFPSSVSFQKYHLKHHSYQGVEALDADMPFRWEARLIDNHVIGKALWLLFYPVFQLLRPLRMTKEISIFDGWTLVNWIVQFSFLAAVIYFGGAKPTIFLVASFFFSIGLHPLGARWIQEHFLTHGEQETKSYYGPLNSVNLNVGFHNEHHDFPSVPWNKLPKIKKMAGAYYDHLGHHTSYTILLFQFLFDRKISIYSRTARSKRGK